MAQSKAALSFAEIKEETQKLAAYLSLCAKQPVEIKLQGHAGLAYTHSIEDSGKKHVIPMVLNPMVLDKIRTRERAIAVWWGLGAHELAHHLWPAAKFYEKAYAEGFGRLFNLIDDEQNERRGRSEHPEWGEWFQSVMPLAFPKKAVFQGNQALTGGFGEENSWIKPGGFIADDIYIRRFNQFGYFLRRHNSEPNLLKDKTVADALNLIPARLKDLTKDELFELTRKVHEVLCRGINKPKEKLEFRNKPVDEKKEVEKNDGSEVDGNKDQDGKDQDGKDKDGKPKDPKDPKDSKDAKPEEKPDGEVKKEDEKDKKDKDGEEDKDAEKKEDEEKDEDADEDKDGDKDKDGKDKKKKKKEKKQKKEKKEKKDSSWKNLLTNKWLLIPVAALLMGWLGLFSMAGTNFWLQIAFFVGQMILFVVAFALLRWGFIKAVYAWMAKKAILDRIRRLFMRKWVRRTILPLIYAVMVWLCYKAFLAFGTVASFFLFGLLLFFYVSRQLSKLSISGGLSGTIPNMWVIWRLRIAATGAAIFALAAFWHILHTHDMGWFGSSTIYTAMGFIALMFVSLIAGIDALRLGKFGLGRGKVTPGFFAMFRDMFRTVFGLLGEAVLLPLRALKWIGLGGLGVLGVVLAGLWGILKSALGFIAWGLGLVFRGLRYGFGGIWRRVWWGLSIALRWTLTKVMVFWNFAGPTLKRLWKQTWFRLVVVTFIGAVVLMLAYAVLAWVAHVNFWLMVALVVLLLLLLLLLFLFRNQVKKFIVNQILQPMPSLMRQFMMPPLDMHTDWFVPIDNVQPNFADQAWLDKHMPEVIALASQLRPIFANCGFAPIDREDQPDGFDLIDEVELAFIGESAIFIDDETVPKPSLHIEYALDCSGSMGFATQSLGPGEKFELGKLMGLAIEHAIIGLPGVTARFWGFRDNVIYDCGTPGQRRLSGLQHGGGNNDSAMLWQMGQSAAGSGKNMKLLLMASDGMPANCSWLSLRNLVLRFEQEGMIPWNFGLDVIHTRAFKNFTDMVGQDKQTAIQTFGRALSTLASDQQ
jgi:hypothetical protein